MIFSAGSVSFTKAQLKALVAHSSTDVTRPHVCAVYFNAAEGAAVSTDGRRMAVCEGEGRAPWTYLVPREAAETAMRIKGAETFILNPVSQDLAAFDKVSHKIATIPATAPTGATFPPYQHVTSAPATSHARQGFNARYLADIRLVTDAVTDSAGRVRFYPAEGELDPAQFRVGRWTVYLMPMRLDPTEEAAVTGKAKGKRGKASQPVQDAPSGAIVLAGGPVSIASVETPQNAKGATSVIVLDTRPVNAQSLGSDLAPIALLAARNKSREREYREIFASTAETPRDVLAAWVEDAA